MRLTLIAVLTALTAAAALAHSPLAATTPVDGAVMVDVPEEIAMNFARSIRLTRVTMVHADDHTEALDLGDQTRFMTEFSLPLLAMGSGIYVIEWRGLGDDGHPQTGTFSFTVE